MELIANPAIHGTAYALGRNVRAEHVLDPSLDGNQYALQVGAIDIVDDKFGFTSNAAEERFAQDIKYDARLVGLCRTLADKYGFPVDVEYLVDQAGTFHVVQVREMSAKHCRNWAEYYSQRPSEVDVSGRTTRRAIVNTVGVVDGKVANFDRDTFTNPESIVVLPHIEMPRWLESRLGHRISNPVVDVHGTDRVRDHLQYASYEDPTVASLQHIEQGEVELAEGEQVTLISNGDSVRKVSPSRRRVADAS